MIGAAQGYWIAYFGIPAFIVTLGGMLVFRALTLTVLGNQGIGPFPDEIRTLANGFTDGYLGNVGLGPLGGADIVSCSSASLVVVGLRVRAVADAACQAWATARPSTRIPLFVGKILLAAVVVMFIVVQLARFRNLPWVLVLLAVLVLALLADGEPLGVRPPHLRRRRQPARPRRCPACGSSR